MLKVVFLGKKYILEMEDPRMESQLLFAFFFFGNLGRNLHSPIGSLVDLFPEGMLRFFRVKIVGQDDY